MAYSLFNRWTYKAALMFKLMHDILVIHSSVELSQNCNYYFEGKQVFKKSCYRFEDISLKGKKKKRTHSNLMKV